MQAAQLTLRLIDPAGSVPCTDLFVIRCESVVVGRDFPRCDPRHHAKPLPGAFPAMASREGLARADNLE
jgi:hypothetical protein